MTCYKKFSYKFLFFITLTFQILFLQSCNPKSFSNPPIPTEKLGSFETSCGAGSNLENGHCVVDLCKISVGCSYKTVIEGYNVFVMDSAQSNIENLNQSLERLRKKLLDHSLRVTALAKLKGKVNFWITDSKWTTSAMVYHNSSGWLIQQGMNPNMAVGIEIINTKNFVAWTSDWVQPMMVLHELSHCYHHLILGLDSISVIHAYESAMASGIYNAVHYNTITGPLRPAYAKTNNLEYFAELTESYFGKNDYYPFTRDQLRIHDPIGFQVMKETWGAL